MDKPPKRRKQPRKKKQPKDFRQGGVEAIIRMTTSTLYEGDLSWLENIVHVLPFLLQPLVLPQGLGEAF